MKNKNKAFAALTSVLLIFSLLVIFIISGIYIYAKQNIDFSLDERLFNSNKTTSITKLYYDESGGLSEYIPKELCSILPAKNRKIWYSYGEIGENLKDAFISVEDRDFFLHRGVNLRRTAFALVNYFLHIKPKFGASTITQQVIKNISGDNEQTLSRKFSEIIRAVNIEKKHTKEEIFELYLNIVPMSEGISGVGFASEYYFGKTPDALTNAEAATLVGITNAPTRYNPYKHPEASLEKRNKVLYTMLDTGQISREEYDEAVSSPLSLVNTGSRGENTNSWFAETVCDDLCRDLAEKKGISESAARLLVLNGGLSVYTTVNPDIQSRLERYFEDESNFPDAVKSGLNYSMVVSDSKNGNLLAIVGGVGKKKGNRLINFALTPRTPGSVIKPLSLYGPIINQKKANWSTLFEDAPVTFNTDSDRNYVPYPRNYPDVYDGAITLSDALRVSKNTVAIRIFNIIGADRIFSSLKRDFGFDTLIDEKTMSDGRKITDKAAAPLALGQLSYGVSLRKLTEAYTVFPSDGTLSRGRSYVAVYDSNGELLLDNPASSKQVFSTKCARIMNKLLEQVTESGTAKAITLDSIVDTAGKTGTSGNDKDRLFVGYTPYYTAGIWCGYEKGNMSIGYQSKSHLEIWDEIMKELHEMRLYHEDTEENFSTVGLEYLAYCKDSGELYSDKCIADPDGTKLAYGYFTDDNMPTHLCKHRYLKNDGLTDIYTSYEGDFMDSIIEKRRFSA